MPATTFSGRVQFACTISTGLKPYAWAIEFKLSPGLTRWAAQDEGMRPQLMGRLVTGVPGKGVLEGVGLERETGASWV